MAQLDGNAKVVKMLINNDLQNNVNGSLSKDPLKYALRCFDRLNMTAFEVKLPL
jgi:sRNA-binding protein